MIIEVKDWDLESYFLDEKMKWRIKHNRAYKKSPVDQVLQYKENIYNIHLSNLLEKKIRNFKYWQVVSCAVYFHNENSDNINKMLIEPYRGNRKYMDFLKYNIDFIGKNTLTQADFDKILFRRFLKSYQYSSLFSDELYESFKRYLMPVWHTREEGEKIYYSSKQYKLAKSEPRDQRIKGVVGSGKTTVLAARAVNSYLRTGSKVLILTYNITLKNYIHDKISRVKEEFSWDKFYINNYHNFITSELNNLGVEILIPEGFSELSNEQKSDYFEREYYSNVQLFIEHETSINKYESIIIDEVQDYKRPWMDIIKTCFLAKGGEYVLFGDEKQNIYGNKLENKDIQTNVKQKSSEMNVNFRSGLKIKDLAINFQKEFFVDKYNTDNFNIQTRFNFDKESQINYLFLSSASRLDSIYNVISKIPSGFDEHPNDITVLGFTTKFLRELDCYYRHMSNQKTNTMFETQEVWHKILLDSFRDSEVIKYGLSFFKRVRNDEEQRGLLAVCFVLKSLVTKFKEDIFTVRLSNLLEKYHVPLENFDLWYFSKEVQQITSITALWKMNDSIKSVRENKKNHFWFNSGTLKFSTIHSFKGWETSTLVLVIEPQY